MCFFKSLFLVSCLSLFSQFCFSADKQLSKDEDEAMKNAAFMMDNGMPQNAVELITRKVLPKHKKDYVVNYELALAYFRAKEYQKSVDILIPLLKHKSVTSSTYQLLGSSYDLLGKRNEAMSVYNKGIERNLSKIGRLYLELGNIYLSEKKYDNAVDCYENGILAEPGFSSNYYWMARLLYNISPIWSLIYGEAFCLLEQGSQRNSDIRNMLSTIYAKNSVVSKDSSLRLDMGHDHNISMSADGKKMYFPFAISYDIMTDKSGVVQARKEKKDTTAFSVDEIISIRKDVVEEFCSVDHKLFRISLFDYQKKILDAGYWQVYNMWLFCGDTKYECQDWFNDNKKMCDGFSDWLDKNPFVPTSDKPTSRRVGSFYDMLNP